MPFLLGLTGNIACGKSTVGSLLTSRYGADYVDADRIVHSLYAAGSPETQAIAARFGADLLQADGTIDRRRLGDIVMADPTARLELERLLDPSVRRAIDNRIESSTSSVVVLDAIRLFEGGLAQRCGAVWAVTCDPEQQVERLLRSRPLTRAQAELRVAAQRPQEEKARQATLVLTNNTSQEELENQISRAWETTIAPRLD